MLCDGGNKRLGLVDLKVLLVLTMRHFGPVDNVTGLFDIGHLIHGEGVSKNIPGEPLSSLFIRSLDPHAIVHESRLRSDGHEQARQYWAGHALFKKSSKSMFRKVKARG